MNYAHLPRLPATPRVGGVDMLEGASSLHSWSAPEMCVYAQAQRKRRCLFKASLESTHRGQPWRFRGRQAGMAA